MLSSLPDVVNPGDTIDVLLTIGPALSPDDPTVLGVRGAFLEAGDSGVIVDTDPGVTGAHTRYFAAWANIIGMTINGTFVDDDTHLTDDRGPVTGG